jgi:hypothetical protein
LQIDRAHPNDATSPAAERAQVICKQNGKDIFLPGGCWALFDIEVHETIAERSVRFVAGRLDFNFHNSLIGPHARQKNVPQPLIVPHASLVRVLVQKFDNGVLAEVDLEPVDRDLNFPRCKALFDLYPADSATTCVGDHWLTQEWRLGSR